MAENSFRLRNAVPEDAQAIADLLAELEHPASAADVPARIQAILAEGGAVLLAVDEDGTRLGLMSLARHSALHTPGPVGYITALVTAGAARRRGVGRALVEAARVWAIHHCCVRMSVTSANHRSDAHAFYPAMGMPYTGKRFSTSLDSPRETEGEDKPSGAPQWTPQ